MTAKRTLRACSTALAISPGIEEPRGGAQVKAAVKLELVEKAMTKQGGVSQGRGSVYEMLVKVKTASKNTMHSSGAMLMCIRRFHLLAEHLGGSPVVPEMKKEVVSRKKDPYLGPDRKERLPKKPGLQAQSEAF